MNITEKHKRFDGGMLKKLARIAVPSVLQQSFISVGQLFVQSLINGLGSVTVAGFTAAIKINTFAIAAMNTMSGALSSFVAQNYGAKKLDRVYKGFRAALAIATGFSAVAVACVFIFGDNLIGLFVDTAANPAVISAGRQFLWTAAPFYFFVTLKILCDGVLRGTGDMKEFMVTTFADLLVRVIFSFVAVLGLGMGFAGICWAYPIGWVVATAFSYYYYKKENWKKAV